MTSTAGPATVAFPNVADFASAFTPTPATIPPDLDLEAILADVADDHVSAPSSQVPGLKQVVAEAQADGIDLSIVVIKFNPAREADLRDLATEIGKQQHGTVVVFSTDWVGTYSESISRVKLEAAEDPAKYSGGNSVAAANQFLDELQDYNLPWTAISSVLLVGTLAAVGGLYFVKARRATAPEPKPESEATDHAV